MFSEVKGCLDFIRHVYGVLGFPYHVKLSTRPQSYMGELALWIKCVTDLLFERISSNNCFCFCAEEGDTKGHLAGLRTR